MNKESKKLANGIVYITCDYLSFGDYDNSCAIERANVRYLKEHDDLKDSIDKRFSMNDWERGDIASFDKNKLHTDWITIESNDKLIETYGGHYSIQLWVREDVWNEMELDVLEDYPSLDDDLVSKVEMDMENTAWDCYIKSDLIRTLPDEPNESELDKQEFHCLQCGYDGVVDQLEIVLDQSLCPECKQPHIKLYPTQTLREFADELDNDTLWDIYCYCCTKTNAIGEVESGGNWYIDVNRLEDAFKEAIEQYRNGNKLCDKCNGSGFSFHRWGYGNCGLCNGTGFMINNNKETESEKLIEREN